MLPGFLIGRDVTWLVFGLINQGEEHLIHRNGTKRVFDLNGIEVGIDVGTPYWVPIWGSLWKLASQVDQEECPVLYFKGDAAVAHEELTVLRMVF